MTTLRPRRPLRLLAPLAIGALLLTGCSDADDPTPAPDNGSEVAPGVDTQVEDQTPDDHATEDQTADDEGTGEDDTPGTDIEAAVSGPLAMSEFTIEPAEFGEDTKAYGTFHNLTDSDVTLVSVGAPWAIRVDFEPEGPWVVPADGSLELTPDGSHIAIGYVNHDIEDDGLYEWISFLLDDDNHVEFGATVN